MKPKKNCFVNVTQLSYDKSRETNLSKLLSYISIWWQGNYSNNRERWFMITKDILWKEIPLFSLVQPTQRQNTF